MDRQTDGQTDRWQTDKVCSGVIKKGKTLEPMHECSWKICHAPLHIYRSCVARFFEKTKIVVADQDKTFSIIGIEKNRKKGITLGTPLNKFL